MTLQELINEIMKESDRFAVEREEMIPIGTEPIKKHKKRRIQKKWLKRYGMKTVYQKKKCKAIDITLDLLVDFCAEKNLPLPDEILAMTRQNDWVK